MAHEPGQETDPLDRVVAELEALRPEEFVGARDRLARTLRQRGDRAAAGRISRLRRPSLSVWAANQLSRAVGGAVEQLVELGAALQEAQQAVMAGEAGAARRVRELAASERHHVAHLAEKGRRLLVGSGYQASQPVRQRLAITLHAAAATAEGRAALVEGRLTQDLDPPGFGDLTQLLGGVPTEEAAPAAPPEPAGQPETAPPPTEDVRAAAALRAAVEEARRAEQAAAVEAVAARRVADQARVASESARTRAGALQLTAGELRRAADDLARRAADAEAAARQAATEADQRAEDAEAAAARAEAAAEKLARAQEARQAAEDAAPSG